MVHMKTAANQLELQHTLIGWSNDANCIWHNSKALKDIQKENIILWASTTQGSLYVNTRKKIAWDKIIFEILP
jgi:virulence-associated protein VapD